MRSRCASFAPRRPPSSTECSTRKPGSSRRSSTTARNPADRVRAGQRADRRLFDLRLDAIYIGARLYDRDPSQIAARILRQGEQVFGDDWFSVMLDPFHDRRSGYRFRRIRTVCGKRRCSRTSARSSGTGRASGTRRRRSTSKVGSPRSRSRSRRCRSIRATTPGASTSAARSRAATSARAGSRATATPIPAPRARSSGSWGSSKASGSTSCPLQRQRAPAVRRHGDDDGHRSVARRVLQDHPSLTGALTINTDFSATEVDDRQVNLTRFGLFFPEKRDFFLQDADIFEFGGLEANGRPFFSRRIGLSETAGRSISKSAASSRGASADGTSAH